MLQNITQILKMNKDGTLG